MIKDASALPGLLNASTQANASYHDLKSLNELRSLGRRDGDAALEAAARQFESHFLKTLIKTMREANEALGDDELFGGESVDFYQEMHDEQLAATLSAQNSLGLADLMIRQLSMPTTTSPKAPRFPLNNNEKSVENAPAPAVPMLLKRAAVAPVTNTEPSQATEPAKFFASVLPQAERAAKALGVPTEILLAQTALETGWGRSTQSGQGNHRYFGIKADGRWQGEAVQQQTLEYVEQKPQSVSALFRDYANRDDAFTDYVNFIKQSPRYQQAISGQPDARQYISGLQQGGYATDPQYADKVMRIYDGDLFKSALSEARKLLGNVIR
ncbi:flagellar assembly peptidoglycan hydrolase FlgJ [Permianibacter aggregans]|uniref:Peptidoglycan hydrolase FlgJ n=1 Tax=Permianibacter aggregans TaxID=1510150 RepID=A0A4R6UTF6_9GAMM|nr:flagellar assembly peptidoglycan hydrolase FlgJ [Permianibacter aggregans]QGX38297.1 flagellar assembly peptidoglycan hydrolase FlgJ [Permianibacter aggregans]TDQ48615.1 flagellar protein FlgJ [Permianibacter aggregans]